MKIRSILVLAALAGLVVPPIAAATPPDHAPAHGYRAKHGKTRYVERTREPEHRRRNGIEVVFDSERGIHVAVGLPGIFFYGGHYYRERDGRWEVSVSGRDGWRVSVETKIPGAVVEARKKKPHHHPGPASKAPRDDDRREHRRGKH